MITNKVLTGILLIGLSGSIFGIDFFNSTSITTTSTTTSVISTSNATVTHNFGAYPVVQVIDSTGEMILPASIKHLSVNAVKVTFGGATTANIILVR